MEHKEYRKLHAEWYELVSGSMGRSKEIDFLAGKIEELGEPALELGSGTGKILIPLIKEGYDVIGIDTSEDMTARCLAACKAKDLKVEIHEQSMLEFDLQREFSLIFLDSGGLSLFTEDHDILATFERVMAHLKPGGHFIYDFELVPDEYEDNNRWTGDWICGPDDVVIAWRKRMKHDPVTNVWQWLFVVEKFVDGRLVETEANERWGRAFTLEEAIQYARIAGFENIKATNWLTDDPPSEESELISVQCRKPVGKQSRESASICG
ncbi:MAG: class I SAM-dependent methyltransferase [Candidatus Aegiribacteria sp.]|nr:class I SAM-dependent methyltransferase [Candidatus Aegiribacteria sp.]